MVREVSSIAKKVNMKSVSSRQVVKVLLKRGWKLKKTNGSHHTYVHPEYIRIATIIHPKKDFSIGMFKSTLENMDITVEEFFSSL